MRSDATRGRAGCRAGATIEGMKPTLEDGLRALREAAELAPHIKIELADDYLALIAQVEAMPQNEAGSDKSWVWRLLEWSRTHYARAVLVR